MDVPPSVCRGYRVALDATVMGRAGHGVEGPGLVGMSRIHRSQGCVVSSGSTLNLAQQGTLMVMHVRVVGHSRLGCGTREVEIAAVGSRGWDAGARRHHRSGVGRVGGCRALGGYRAGGGDAGRGGALGALLPRVEALTDCSVGQRRGRLVGQLVALRRQHGQWGTSQTRVVLERKWGSVHV